MFDEPWCNILNFDRCRESHQTRYKTLRSVNAAFRMSGAADASGWFKGENFLLNQVGLGLSFFRLNWNGYRLGWWVSRKLIYNLEDSRLQSGLLFNINYGRHVFGGYLLVILDGYGKKYNSNV